MRRAAALALLVALLAPLVAHAGGRVRPLDQPRWLVPPQIVEGEAGTCDERAMRAVVWVDANHRAATGRAPRWYGWRAHPSVEAYRAAAYATLFPDPTRGALHLFSAQDLQRAAVQRLIRRGGLVEHAVFRCAGGLRLHAFGVGP